MRPSVRKSLSTIKDIHQALHTKEFTLPETVYILGSGPNATSVLHKIPKDAFVIAVNRGAEIPRVFNTARFEIAVWMIADFTTTKKSYFKPTFHNFEGIRIFSEPTIVQVKPYEIKNQEKMYSFRLTKKDLLQNEFLPMANYFRTDCTVAGCALWLAFQAGCKKVILVGIDMGGDADISGKLPPDPRHGSEWRYRRLLDSQIAYQQGRGMHIHSLSDTKLLNVSREKGENLPGVAYVCFSWLPFCKTHAIISAVDQNYPNTLKNLYLITQDPKQSVVEHGFPIRIVENCILPKSKLDQEKGWTDHPEIWLEKWERFLEICTEDYFIVWDEDDRFEYDYTMAAILPMLKRHAVFTYNKNMVICREGKFVYDRYSTAYGTLAGKVKDMKDLIHRVRKNHPEGYGLRKRDHYTKVPLDGALMDFIWRAYDKKTFNHGGTRYYILHEKANSILNGHMKKEDAVDYKK
jgi:hypothetical protein